MFFNCIFCLICSLDIGQCLSFYLLYCLAAHKIYFFPIKMLLLSKKVTVIVCVIVFVIVNVVVFVFFIVFVIVFVIVVVIVIVIVFVFWQDRLLASGGHISGGESFNRQ